MQNEIMQKLSGKDDSRKHLTAGMNFSRNRNTWHLYASGYRNAANALVYGFEQGHIQQHLINTTIYPIAFLYRHSIELWIKQMLFSCGKLLGESIDLQKSHELDKLWSNLYSTIKDRVYPYVNHEEGEEDKQLIKSVQNGIRQFTEIDRSSMAFRYPTDKKGMKFLTDLDYVHLGRLAEFCNEVLDNLEAMSMWLSNLIDEQSDWLSIETDLNEGADESLY